MSGPLDDFLTQVVRDCVGPAAPERDHSHLCPRCDSSWLHAESECDYTPVEIVPGYPINQTWAVCPMCEREGR